MGTSTADRNPTGALTGSTVAVLFGGASSEREVSRVTGMAVLDALRTPATAADRRGPAEVRAVEILPDGRWLVEELAQAPAQAALALAKLDVFFLALHGGVGEDGTLQGLLASLGYAYTGSGVRASAIGMDKLATRELVASRGTRVPRTRLLTRDEWGRDRTALAKELQRWGPSEFGSDAGREPGWVTKPRAGGSSVGVSIVRALAELPAALQLAFAEEDEVLVEAFVPGTEVACGVLVDGGGRMRSLPAVEIRPHDGRFFDYDEKYSGDGAEEFCPPRTVDAATCARLAVLSLEAHRVLGCAGYSRSDFIVPLAGGEPVFLELNTLPGLTPRSLLPQAAAAAGIDYRSLCLNLLTDGLARKQQSRVERIGAP